MARYRVLVNFKDLQDNGYFYAAGAEYPRAGKRVGKKRLAELASDANRRKTPMIELIEETAEEE